MPVGSPTTAPPASWWRRRGRGPGASLDPCRIGWALAEKGPRDVTEIVIVFPARAPGRLARACPGRGLGVLARGRRRAVGGGGARGGYARRQGGRARRDHRGGRGAGA